MQQGYNGPILPFITYLIAAVQPPQSGRSMVRDHTDMK